MFAFAHECSPLLPQTLIAIYTPNRVVRGKGDIIVCFVVVVVRGLGGGVFFCFVFVFFFFEGSFHGYISRTHGKHLFRIHMCVLMHKIHSFLTYNTCL